MRRNTTDNRFQLLSKKHHLLFLLAVFFLAVTVCNAQKVVIWKELDSLSRQMQSLTYRTTGDTLLKIYFIKPKQTKHHKKFPGVFWIHGGGWTGGTAKTFFAHSAYFSLRGAVGISIEYRLVKAGKNDITDCIADCKSAIRFIKAHAEELNIDTSKIIIGGDSAGGHLAACMATLDDFNNGDDDLSISVKPSALLLYNPGLDLTVFPLIKTVNADALKQKAASFDTAAFNKQFYQKAYTVSPLFHIRKGIAPTLLMHGLDDKIILPEQSERFNAEMKKAGNYCKLVLLTNTRHAFVVPYYTASEEKVVNAVCEADRFLVSLGYLKGKARLKVSKVTIWPAKY